MRSKVECAEFTLESGTRAEDNFHKKRNFILDFEHSTQPGSL